jgi:hypothetical protein
MANSRGAWTFVEIQCFTASELHRRETLLSPPKERPPKLAMIDRLRGKTVPSVKANAERLLLGMPKDGDNETGNHPPTVWTSNTT